MTFIIIASMFIIVFILAIVTTIYAIAILISAPRYKGIASDHFDGKRFFNPHGQSAKGLADVFKWLINRKKVDWKEDTNEGYGKHPLSHYNEGIRITFVNHSTFLIQVDGLNILTDPIWSERASPFSWVGPKRRQTPGIKFEDLPRIHVILLSHNHYDHLDLPTLRVLFGGHHPAIITPLGVKAFLDKKGISGSTDLDWWNQLSLSDTIKVQAVPALHFSGRGGLDRDATLWCGYILYTRFGKIYFAGDTGYHEQSFKEIGERIGAIRLSLLPIGAYKPSWFMSPIHTSPEEAVKIHLNIKSQQSIASHFGTFPLADEGRSEPVQELLQALKKYNLAENDFLALKEGEVYIAE
jgi:L-ascorbate metabolism protein UlaG (beta-lactamase superfamily)